MAKKTAAKTKEKRNGAGRTEAQERARVDRVIECADTQRAAITEQVKRRRAGQPPAYTSPLLLACRLADYIRTAYEQESPILMNGMYRAAGLTERTWYDYQRGDRDHITDSVLTEDGTPLQSREGPQAVEKIIARYLSDNALYPYLWQVYTGLNPAEIDAESMRDYFTEERANKNYRSTYSQIIQNARANLHTDVEKHLIGGKIGDIMRAKVILGWQDERTTVHRIDMDRSEKEERLTLLEG